MEEERRSQLEYSRATIYVRQVDKIGIAEILLDVPPSTPSEDPDFQVILLVIVIMTIQLNRRVENGGSAVDDQKVVDVARSFISFFTLMLVAH